MKKLLLSLGLLAALAGSAAAVVSTTNVGDVAYSVLSTDIRVATTTTLTASRTWTLPSAGATCIGQTCSSNALEILDIVGAVSVADPLVIAPASGETINGSTASLTLNAPFARVILIPVNGSDWQAQVSISDVQVFQTAGGATWTAQRGKSWVQVLACAAGGGGGGGGVGPASGTAWGGGAGGGGGACIQQTFRASDLGASQVLTIGAAATAATNTQSGTVGGNTCFGGTAACGGTPLIQAYGGGGGSVGLTGAGGTGGGGGGGYAAVGTSVSASGTGGAAVFNGAAGGSALAGGNASGFGGGAGGAGGTAAGAAGVAGGNAVFSAPGGGVAPTSRSRSSARAPARASGSRRCRAIRYASGRRRGLGDTRTLVNPTTVSPGAGGGMLSQPDIVNANANRRLQWLDGN